MLPVAKLSAVSGGNREEVEKVYSILPNTATFDSGPTKGSGWISKLEIHPYRLDFQPLVKTPSSG